MRLGRSHRAGDGSGQGHGLGHLHDVRPRGRGPRAGARATCRRSRSWRARSRASGAARWSCPATSPTRRRCSRWSRAPRPRSAASTSSINAAGVTGPIETPVQEIKVEDFRAVLESNIVGTFLPIKHVLPGMIARRYGKIVNISGTSGLRGYKYRTAYSSSKWALRGLTRTVALEAGPHNVNVNALHPGIVAGDRMDKLCREKAKKRGWTPEQVYQEYVDEMALRRVTVSARHRQRGAVPRVRRVVEHDGAVDDRRRRLGCLRPCAPARSCTTRVDESGVECDQQGPSITSRRVLRSSTLMPGRKTPRSVCHCSRYVCSTLGRVRYARRASSTTSRSALFSSAARRLAARNTSSFSSMVVRMHRSISGSVRMCELF